MIAEGGESALAVAILARPSLLHVIRNTIAVPKFFIALYKILGYLKGYD